MAITRTNTSRCSIKYHTGLSSGELYRNSRLFASFTSERVPPVIGGQGDRKVAPPKKPGASRRFVLVGLAGLMIVVLTGGIVWFTLHHAASVGSITESPHSTPTPSPPQTACAHPQSSQRSSTPRNPCST